MADMIYYQVRPRYLDNDEKTDPLYYQIGYSEMETIWETVMKLPDLLVAQELAKELGDDHNVEQWDNKTWLVRKRRKLPKWTTVAETTDADYAKKVQRALQRFAQPKE